MVRWIKSETRNPNAKQIPMIKSETDKPGIRLLCALCFFESLRKSERGIAQRLKETKSGVQGEAVFEMRDWPLAVGGQVLAANRLELR